MKISYIDKGKHIDTNMRCDFPLGTTYGKYAPLVFKSDLNDYKCKYEIIIKEAFEGFAGEDLPVTTIGIKYKNGDDVLGCYHYYYTNDVPKEQRIDAYVALIKKVIEAYENDVNKEESNEDKT